MVRRTGRLRSTVLSELLLGSEDGYLLSTNYIVRATGSSQQSVNRVLRQLLEDGVVTMKRSVGHIAGNHMAWENLYMHKDRASWQQQFEDDRRAELTESKITERLDAFVRKII